MIGNPSKASLPGVRQAAPSGLAIGLSADLSIDSLVAGHYGFIWRVLRGLGLSRTDAEDATQQVFMIAARKIDQIEANCARSFLYGTALRVANNARRGQRRRREVPAEETSDEPEPESRGPEKMTELARAQRLLTRVLDQLPEKHRRMIILAEIEQLAVPEIATLEGVPVGTAASRLRIAREKFRTRLSALRAQNPFGDDP